MGRHSRHQKFIMGSGYLAESTLFHIAPKAIEAYGGGIEKMFPLWTQTPDNSYTFDPSLDYKLEILGDDKQICSYAADGAKTFFMAYTAMFDQFHIHFPFSNFQIEVLDNLHLAPSQLHPNG
jgi:hypothetical protein